MEEGKKNKKRCICKKKCKGPCKALKENKNNKEEVKEKKNEILNNGDLDEDGIPVFLGRKKQEGGDNKRDIHLRGVSLNFQGTFLLEDANIMIAWG